MLEHISWQTDPVLYKITILDTRPQIYGWCKQLVTLVLKCWWGARKCGVFLNPKVCAIASHLLSPSISASEMPALQAKSMSGHNTLACISNNVSWFVSLYYEKLYTHRNVGTFLQWAPSFSPSSTLTFYYACFITDASFYPFNNLISW